MNIRLLLFWDPPSRRRATFGKSSNGANYHYLQSGVSKEHRQQALDDPKGFLSQLGIKVVLDEIQKSASAFKVIFKFLRMKKNKMDNLS